MQENIANVSKPENTSQSVNSFTNSQMQVLKHSTGNLLVSASAGSGKTRVLIEKINRLILNGGVKLKRLLVVTFTNSASLEIKQRLATSLAESGDQKLLSELDDLSTSDILTFDAFCIKVVKEFGYSIGQSDNFSVADEALASFLKNQALDNIIAAHNKSFDVKFTNFVSNFFDARNEKTLRTSIARLHDFLRSKDDGETYVDKLDLMFSLNAENPAIKFANDYLNDLKNNSLQLLGKLKLESEMLGESSLAEKIELAIGIIQNIKGDILCDYDTLKFGINLPMIKKDNKKDGLEILDIKTQYASIKNKFVDGVKGVMPEVPESFSIQSMQNDLIGTKQSLQYIFEIVNEFDAEYNRLKNFHSVLDFNDIEKLASKVLTDEQIANTVKNRYDWIFIDEYQDTSKLQDSIVKQITTGENLFMVGDLKQSIYRFRQAEPKIFINKYNQYRDMKSSNSVIELATNFRSENSILQFNNYVFDKIYKESIDDIDYKGKADLQFGGLVKKSSDAPQVKVLIIDEEEHEEAVNDAFEITADVIESENNFEVYSVKDSSLGFGKDKVIKKQALLLANEIKNMLGKPFYDVKTGSIHSIDYKDIAVLSRSKVGVVLEVKKVLQDANIPVMAEYAENLFDSFDMQILLNILKAIDNSKNDIPLLTALVNMGGVSFDELAKIRSEHKIEKFFYEAVSEYVKKNDNDLTAKIKYFFEKLDFYRSRSTNLDICELVNLICAKENFETYFAANNYSVEFDNHLRIFLDSIKSIKDYSLCEFLNYLDSFGGEILQDVTAKDGENAVTLTTIHKSKGLEYPVVFVVGTEKKFSRKNQAEKILTDNDWGICMSSFYADSHTSYHNIIKKIFKLKIQTEDKKEEKRLLYVGLTRAKNYLTIIGSKKVERIKPIETDFDIVDCNSYLDWITGTISLPVLNQLKSQNIAIQEIGDGEVAQIEVIRKNEFNFDTNFKDKTLPERLQLSKQEFFDILSQKFHHTNLAKKNTVTQIMQEENDHYNISDFSYKKTDNFGDEDFLAVGTAYHKLMELIDFENDDNKILSQISKLNQFGQITDAELKMVNTSEIVNSVKIISGLIEEKDIVLKEQQFLAYMPASELVGSMETEKILVQGVADILIIKQDVIYLIDYKTSRLSSEQKFVEKYRTQLDIYAKAIERFFKKPVAKKFVYSFYLNKLVTI